MSDYVVVARKYRPQFFKEVLGQDALVTTLKNAIQFQRLAHAYLFSGSRGTGKTTLARLFAKALNCPARSTDMEPCGTCSSCKEIAAGTSLDVLEIDGASHRGIEDIRQINEAVGYVSASGGYKVYIIDEVHMLTKEAFNALLKTLEEPPPKVIFLFATTEPHKVLPTIVSRCQRFNLKRIPAESIVKKLSYIAQQLNLEADEEALQMVAQMADGGLRDAESLLDQIFSFHNGKITTEVIQAIFGLLPTDIYFELDRAGKEGNLAKAFELAQAIFHEGKDFSLFLEGLVGHFRNLLLVKLCGIHSANLRLLKSDKARYEASATLYTKEQCAALLEYLLQAQQDIRFSPSPITSLEAILLKVLRSHQRLPIEFLVQKLAELEKRLNTIPSEPEIKTEVVQQVQQIQSVQAKPAALPPPKAPPAEEFQPKSASAILTEDPTPSFKDLGVSAPKPAKPLQEAQPKPAKPLQDPQPKSSPAAPAPNATAEPVKLPPMTKLEQSRYDTLMQFAAVELEGTIQRKSLIK